MRLHFQKGDCIAIGAVVLLAALVFVLFLPKPAQSAVVEIYHNGVLVQTMPLSQNGQYTLQGTYENVIAVSGGKVSITQSDCPGHDCVYSGAISTVGRSLVCLPNGVEVRIVGRSGDVDFVVG